MACGVEVGFPHRRLVFVVEVGRAVGFGQDVGVSSVLPAHRQKSPAHRAVEFFRKPLDHLIRSTIDRLRNSPQRPMEHVG